MGKTAIITGITGQDGAYLSRLLLAKGYAVHGVKRRSSLFNTARIDSLFENLHGKNPRFFLHDSDLTDTGSLTHIMRDTRPDEIYNLAAQSHVKVSFETPEYTANADGIGTLRILEALRILGMERHTRFYQASTSELYGKVAETPQSETTPFYPRSPYAAAKLYAYWITVNYREAYGMFASNGILFNHESELRGETFVTRKITRAAARIARGLENKLRLGNLSAKRDWGHSEDYVEAMWRMLRHDKADDFVIATGETRSVREFVQAAFKHAEIDIEWKGEGLDEKGVNARTGEVLVEVDPAYFRPAEVEILMGNPAKAERVLGWRRKVTFDELVRRMVEHDLRLVDKDQSVADAGFDVLPALEDR